MSPELQALVEKVAQAIEHASGGAVGAHQHIAIAAIRAAAEAMQEASEGMIDAGSEAHADAFTAAKNAGFRGLAPCEWLPVVYEAFVAASVLGEALRDE